MRGVAPVKLRGPHLVLAYVGGDDGIALGEVVELVDDLLHAQAALLLVAKGIFFLVAGQVRQPLLGIQLGDPLVEFDQRGFGIADDLHIGHDHLVHLGGIDVDVDDLGVLTKLVDLSDDAVVKA